MPASVSSSSMSSSSNGGGGCCRDCHGVSVTVCHLCDTMTPQNGPCPMMSCTPIDALPGHYQDQQRYPLPPIPRERGRSRATTRGRAPMPPSGAPPPHPVCWGPCCQAQPEQAYARRRAPKAMTTSAKTNSAGRPHHGLVRLGSYAMPYRI